MHLLHEMRGSVPIGGKRHRESDELPDCSNDKKALCVQEGKRTNLTNRLLYYENVVQASAEPNFCVTQASQPKVHLYELV